MVAANIEARRHKSRMEGQKETTKSGHVNTDNTRNMRRVNSKKKPLDEQS